MLRTEHRSTAVHVTPAFQVGSDVGYFMSTVGTDAKFPTVQALP